MGASLWQNQTLRCRLGGRGAKAPPCLGSCWHPLTGSLPNPGSVLCCQPPPWSRALIAGWPKCKAGEGGGPRAMGSQGTCSIFLAPGSGARKALRTHLPETRPLVAPAGMAGLCL